VPRAFVKRFYCTRGKQRNQRADLGAMSRPGIDIRIRPAVPSDANGGNHSGSYGISSIGNVGAGAESSTVHAAHRGGDDERGSISEADVTAADGGGSSPCRGGSSSGAGGGGNAGRDRNFTKVRYVKSCRLYEMYDSPSDTTTQRGIWVKVSYAFANKYRVAGEIEAGKFAFANPYKWWPLRGGAIDPGDPQLGQCMAEALSRLTAVEQYKYCDSLRKVQMCVRPHGQRITKWGWPEQTVYNDFKPTLKVFCARARHDHQYLLQVYLSDTHTELHFIAVRDRHVFDGELVRPLSEESFTELNGITRIVGGYRWKRSPRQLRPHARLATTTRVTLPLYRGRRSVRRSAALGFGLEGCPGVVAANSKACGTAGTKMSSSCSQVVGGASMLSCPGETPNSKTLKNRRRKEKKRKRNSSATSIVYENENAPAILLIP
jgi:hypothetical protein